MLYKFAPVALIVIDPSQSPPHVSSIVVTLSIVNAWGPVMTVSEITEQPFASIISKE